MIYQTPLNFKLLFFISIALLASIAWEGIVLLANRWTFDEAYNHGFILLALIGYLLYLEREELNTLQFGHSWLSFCAFAGLVGILLVAYVTQIQTLQYQAFLLALCFLITAAMGKASLKVLLPLSLLIFAIPLPFFTQVALTADLQLLSTTLAADTLRALSVPVFVEGNIIDLGGYQLQVVEACAGLNYMIPLLGLSHIFAYMFKTVMWKRVLLVISAIPISVLLNSARIAITGILMDSYDINTAEGFFHGFQGWLIFIISIAILSVELILLNKIGSQRINLAEMLQLGGNVARENQQPKAQPRSIPHTLTAAAMISVLAASLTFYLETRPEIIPERPNFASFPNHINGWKGEQFPAPIEQMQALGADDHLMANYHYGESNHRDIELFVAYFDRQSDNKNPHSPKACLPGSGWDILSIEQVTKKVSDTRTIPINKMIIQKGPQKVLLYYWFNLHGRNIANEYHMKAHMLKDRVLLNRSDGAIIRLTAAVHSEEKLTDTEKRMDQFLIELNPVMEEFIPSI